MRSEDHSMIAKAAAASTAVRSTITDVSTRRPSHVMATSPGRSASQTAPNTQEPQKQEIEGQILNHRAGPSQALRVERWGLPLRRCAPKGSGTGR